MKKVESVHNDSPGYGKTSPFATFPQFLFALLSLILPEKFKMKRGKENAEHTAPSQLLVLKHIAIKLLILTIAKKGGPDEINKMHIFFNFNFPAYTIKPVFLDKQPCGGNNRG